MFCIPVYLTLEENTKLFFLIVIFFYILTSKILKTGLDFFSLNFKDFLYIIDHKIYLENIENILSQSVTCLFIL